MMRDSVLNLIAQVQAVTDLEPFEGYRTAERQLGLYQQRPKVTQVGPYASPHQWGLAVDFALMTPSGVWEWPDAQDPVWDQLQRVARLCGLRVPAGWDPGHVEHPDWAYMRSKIRG